MLPNQMFQGVHRMLDSQKLYVLIDLMMVSLLGMDLRIGKGENNVNKGIEVDIIRSIKNTAMECKLITNMSL